MLMQRAYEKHCVICINVNHEILLFLQGCLLFFYSLCSIFVGLTAHTLFLCFSLAQHCWSELWAMPWGPLQTFRSTSRVSHRMHTWVAFSSTYFNSSTALIVIRMFDYSGTERYVNVIHFNILSFVWECCNLFPFGISKHTEVVITVY